MYCSPKVIQKINESAFLKMSNKTTQTEHAKTENNETEEFSIPFKDRLEYDKLSFYYISLPIMLIGNMMGALLLSAMQLNVVDMYSISIWLLISFVMFIYGLYQYSQFRKESEENKLRDVRLWFDKYYTHILVNGIIWGSSAFLMFPEANILNQMIVLFFLFAVSFASMGILAAKKDLLLTYVLVTYVPIMARLFFMEDKLYLTIAYAILSLILIMILIANYYGKAINNALLNRQQFATIKQTHEKLKERFFSLFERAPVGIYYYNKDLELEDANTHFLRMNRTDSIIGLNLANYDNEQIINMHKSVFDSIPGDYRGPLKSFNNDNLFVKLSTVPMINAEGEIGGGIAIVNDITKEITTKEKMIRNVYYDMLTNIPNRTLLVDKLKDFIKDGRDGKEYAALLFIDIDNFKKVNETFGHDAGDALLKQVAQRIEDTIGSKDMFARVSSNKFVILIRTLDMERDISENSVVEYITNINSYFVQPLNVAGEEYHLSFTIGITMFNSSESSAFDILKKSETAMNTAKKNGKGSYQFYESSMSDLTREQLMLENNIHKAIKNNEFTMCYQPQFNIETNKIFGAEALIRWKHPTEGYISPAKFIPVAEESGIIIKLEEWIFDKVISDIKLLSEKEGGFGLEHIAINVSAVHFLQPNFIETLMLLIEKYQVKPEWIELEITEGSIMPSIDDAIEKIKELKEFGFSFSIDDFGTGYSSLSYLKKLPVDTIKIDQSFILNMHQDKGDAMIVESIVAIGQKFNLKILAEGVENVSALNYLKIIRCDSFQGNYGHMPMSLNKLSGLI